MSANIKRPRRERRRPLPPMILPDDLYDYAGDRSPGRGASQGIGGQDAGIDRIAVIDDWPESIPVTEAEIDIFERYFGDVLDRLFAVSGPGPRNQGLHELTSDVNDMP